MNKHIFSVSGRSANIVSSGSDLGILLTDKQIEEARRDFKDERVRMLMKKLNIDEATAIKQEDEKPANPPERIYRERISDQEGMLLIYLQDLRYVFRQEPGEKADSRMGTMIREQGFDLDIPLVGYAFGFPPIFPDPGGVYAVSKYWSRDEEEGTDEFDEELQTEEF